MGGSPPGRNIRHPGGGSGYEYDYDYAGRRILTWLPGYGITEQQHYWDNRQFAYWAEDGSTYFEHQDALGTERMRTNYSGAISSEYSSSALPFNDGDTTVPSGSGSDQETLRFAGLNKDSATTDNAQFRQYSQTHGRWTSPDPYDGSYDTGNPQSFNRYSYVGNNPLGHTDPSGQVILAPGSGGGDGDDDDDDFGSWLADLFSWIGGGGKPKFSGSTGPRPSISEDGSLQASGDPDWTNPLSEHLGLKAGTPLGGGGIAGALGLPTGGCEFGACGSSFTGPNTSGAYPNGGDPADLNIFGGFLSALKETIFGKKPSGACLAKAQSVYEQSGRPLTPQQKKYYAAYFAGQGYAAVTGLIFSKGANAVAAGASAGGSIYGDIIINQTIRDNLRSIALRDCASHSE